MKSVNEKDDTVLVSVVVTIYNKAPYLKRCFQSILQQNFKQFEIIAIDDCSTDNSLQIARELASQDKRIKLYVNNKNSGPSAAANKAIGFAKGRYLARMDADDIMSPDRLEKQIEFLTKNSEYIAVGGQVKIVDKHERFIRVKNTPITNEAIKRSLFLFNPIQHGTMTIDRKKLPEDFQWYPKDINNAEDYDLLIRLTQHGKVHNLKEILLEYRYSESSLSRQNLKQSFLAMYHVRQRAVQLYGFQPGLIPRLLSQMQWLACTIFPDKVIDLLFNLFTSCITR